MTDPDLEAIGAQLQGNAAAYLDALAAGWAQVPEPPAQFALGRSGGPKTASFDELIALAASAKTKVKAGPIGWSRVTQHEIVALAWFADLFLADAKRDAPAPTRARPAPPVISNV